jgi:urease accessory protein
MANTDDTDRGLVHINAVVGNVDDAAWHARLDGALVDVLHLDEIEAQKSRLRKATERGAEVALSLDRGTQLRDGDVLFWDQVRRAAIVAHVELKEVLVIDLAALVAEPEVAMARCVELGHALGNQHWPAVVKGLHVYVPMTVARDVMASVMRTHSFEGISYDFVPGAAVTPYLAPHEARRLFGVTEDHSHMDVAGAHR